MDDDADRAARLRLSLLTGVHSAMLRRDEVQVAVSAATDRADALMAVQSLLGLDAVQAGAVLEISWGRLTKAGIADIAAEITRLTDSLGD